MSEWTDIIENEDRFITNSDRRYRRHCIALEAVLTDEGKYKISGAYDNDPANSVHDTDFTSNLQNERLAQAFCTLTAKQQIVIRLIYWEGFNHTEAAMKLNCDRTTVTKLLSRALISLKKSLTL